LHTVVPLILHGDGVEYVDTDSLEVLSFGPLLGTGDSLDCLFCFGVWPYSCNVKPSAAKPGTWTVPWEVFVWSFKALAAGKHPASDWTGKPFVAGSEQARLAGTPLTPEGHKFVIWSIAGDHEHHANFFKLPHWAAKKWCWDCNANKDDGTGLSFKEDGPEGCTRRGAAEELVRRISGHQVFTIPGVTSCNADHDPLHVLYCKGVLSHFFGSVIHSLIYNGNNTIPTQQKMAILWQKCQELYVRNNTPPSSRLTSLQLSMICDPKKPFQDHPFLKVKASECKYLLPVMEGLCRLVNDGTQVGQWRLEAAVAIHKFSKFLDNTGPVPTDSVADEAKSCVEKFLHVYDKLNAHFADTKLYHKVPKFHNAHEMAVRMKHLNPRYAWTFKCEDFVGKISKCAHNCTFGTARLNVSKPITRKIRQLVHLRLTRGDFTD